MHPFCRLAAASVLLSQPAQSQTPFDFVDRISLQGTAGQGNIGVTRHKVVWWPATSETPFVTDLHLTNADYIAQIADSVFVVSGKTSAGLGGLERVRTSFDGVITDGVTEYADVSFAHLVYAPKLARLFSINDKDGSLIAISTTNLADQSAGEIEVVATPSELPILDDPVEDLFLDVARPPNDGVVIDRRLDTMNRYRGWRISFQDDRPGFYPESHVPAPEPSWHLEFARSIDNDARASGFSIQGIAGGYAIREDLSGSIVASGALSSSAPHRIPFDGIVPGACYNIESTDGFAENSVGEVFVSRWGTPNAHPALQASSIDTPLGCEAGSNSFAITGTVHLSQSNRTDTIPIECYLWIGVNTGNPVVKLPDGTTAISPGALLGTVGPFSVQVTNRRAALYTRVRLPDPGGGFDFHELLFQFAIIHGGDVACSDVVGTTLFGAWDPYLRHPAVGVHNITSPIDPPFPFDRDGLRYHTRVTSGR